MPFSDDIKNPPEPLCVKGSEGVALQVIFQVKIKLKIYPLQVNLQVNCKRDANSSRRKNYPFLVWDGVLDIPY